MVTSIKRCVRLWEKSYDPPAPGNTVEPNVSAWSDSSSDHVQFQAPGLPEEKAAGPLATFSMWNRCKAKELVLIPKHVAACRIVSKLSKITCQMHKELNS